MLNMLMKIALPKMGELLVMMIMMISPSGREVPPEELLHRRAKVLLPKFRLEVAALCPECPPLIFFLGQNDLYTRRWAPGVGRGGQHPPGRAWAYWRAQVCCAHLVALLWYLFAPIFIKYSIKIPRGVLAHLELCRIGSLT